MGRHRRSYRARCLVGLLASLPARLLARVPPAAAPRLGFALGTLAYWILSGRRRVALENLARSFGHLRPAERARLARESFRHLGATVVECCRLFLGQEAPLLARVRIEGLQHVKAALAEGRGAFYLTAHFGNWELLAAAHRLTGLPLSVVVRPLGTPYLETLLTRGRERNQLRLIPKRQAVRGVVEALARGDCVGILLDQDAGPRGVFVPFLGRPASTSRTLAVLALRTGAPVVPVSIRRLPEGDHEVVIEPALALVRTGDRHRDVAVNTARFAAAIERWVRAEPAQWLWVHRRWKSLPP